jgi:aspartate racemase
MINMPQEVFKQTLKECKNKTSIGLLATEGTIKTGIYNKFFDKNFNLVFPEKSIQKNSVNRAIKLVKMGKVKNANKIIKKAINYLIKRKCKKIILGCTELPIAIFAFKSFKTIKSSKIFLDPNFILAKAAMKKYLKK